MTAMIPTNIVTAATVWPLASKLAGSGVAGMPTPMTAPMRVARLAQGLSGRRSTFRLMMMGDLDDDARDDECQDVVAIPMPTSYVAGRPGP
jgi:hypothetical protein